MDTETGTIVVVRPKGGWRDFARAYAIEVDGEPRGTLRRGQRLELPVSSGHHDVRARIDWTGSPKLEVVVAAGSTVTCSVAPAGSAAKALGQLGDEDSWLTLTQEG